MIYILSSKNESITTHEITTWLKYYDSNSQLIINSSIGSYPTEKLTKSDVVWVWRGDFENEHDFIKHDKIKFLKL